jgi:hypothetical protein
MAVMLAIVIASLGSIGTSGARPASAISSVSGACFRTRVENAGQDRDFAEMVTATS